MRKYLFVLLIAALPWCVSGQSTNPNHKWFEESRFGMFVHFGAFSTLCDGEWVLYGKRIPVDDYKKLQDIFNPQLFDAKEWVDLAKEAGMKYIVFTSRHHDSFSNWDTKQSDWNVMNTPYGKDIVKQLADECHRQGIKIGFYYSLLDWVREDYWHNGRTGGDMGWSHKGDWDSYIRFMKAQLTELLTNYGEVSVIWFDGEWDHLPHGATSHDQSAVDWHLPEIYDLIHTLQPNCMIANNHHLPPLPGEDYQAFEKDLPGQNDAGYSENQTVEKNLPLETCETMNHTWGYQLRDNNFKSTKELLHLLINAAGYGSNLLLNVGPKPTGEIEEICVLRLKEMGKWLDKYGYTIYETKGGFISPQAWGAVTQKGKTCYVHVLNGDGASLSIQFPSQIKSARWLNVGDSKLKWKQDKKTGNVVFDLSVASLDDIDSIIEIVLK